MKLSDSIGSLDINPPLVFSECIDWDLSGDYVMPTTAHLTGVYFKGDTAGAYRCVTLYQYRSNGGEAYSAQSGGPTDGQMNTAIHAAIAAGDTVDMLLAAYEISSCPVVFIEADVVASTTANVFLP